MSKTFLMNCITFTKTNTMKKKIIWIQRTENFFDYIKSRLTDYLYEPEDERASQPDRLMLPKWVMTSEERFNEILNTVTGAKNNGLKINVNGE